MIDIFGSDGFAANCEIFSCTHKNVVFSKCELKCKPVQFYFIACLKISKMWIPTRQYYKINSN